MSAFYAVARGRLPGIYKTWPECEHHVKGYSGAKFKKFNKENDAKTFIRSFSSVKLPVHTVTKNDSEVFRKPPPTERFSRPIQEVPLIENEIRVFTDGSCPNNGSYVSAGYAAVFPHQKTLYTGGTLLNHNATNNRAEYIAFLKACDTADLIDPDRTKTLHVYTDSKDLIKTATLWMDGWKKRNWKKADGHTPANLDLVKEIDYKISIRKIIFTHVPAHTGNPDWKSIWNKMADKIANHYARI